MVLNEVEEKFLEINKGLWHVEPRNYNMFNIPMKTGFKIIIKEVTFEEIARNLDKFPTYADPHDFMSERYFDYQTELKNNYHLACVIGEFANRVGDATTIWNNSEKFWLFEFSAEN